MRQRRLVAIPCTLDPGMFSSERVFRVTMADGKTYQGIAPSHFCWNEKGVLVSENGPAQSEKGLVAARLVEILDDEQNAVELPDGEVIAVRVEHMVDRPTVITPPKPETAPNVLVGP